MLSRRSCTSFCSLSTFRMLDVIWRYSAGLRRSAGLIGSSSLFEAIRQSIELLRGRVSNEYSWNAFSLLALAWIFRKASRGSNEKSALAKRRDPSSFPTERSESVLGSMNARY